MSEYQLISTLRLEQDHSVTSASNDPWGLYNVGCIADGAPFSPVGTYDSACCLDYTLTSVSDTFVVYDNDLTTDYIRIY